MAHQRVEGGGEGGKLPGSQGWQITQTTDREERIHKSAGGEITQALCQCRANEDVWGKSHTSLSAQGREDTYLSIRGEINAAIKLC